MSEAARWGESGDTRVISLLDIFVDRPDGVLVPFTELVEVIDNWKHDVYCKIFMYKKSII